MEKKGGPPLSFAEWYTLFELLDNNVELSEIIKKLKGRNRTTINRAYNVGRQLYQKGNSQFDEPEIMRITKEAKYGTTEKYVTDAVYKYKSWLKKDIIQEAIILPKKCTEPISQTAYRIAELWVWYPGDIGHETVEDILRDNEEAMMLLQSSEAKWLLSHIKNEKPEWFTHILWSDDESAKDIRKMLGKKDIDKWTEFTMDDLYDIGADLVDLLKLRAIRKDFKGFCDVCEDKSEKINRILNERQVKI